MGVTQWLTGRCVMKYQLYRRGLGEGGRIQGGDLVDELR